MLNKDGLIQAIHKVAVALGPINESSVFVGGAILGLYVDDPAADDVRPTEDIDVSLSVASIVALEAVREELVSRGFRQSSDDDIICRFRFEDIKIDVMNTEAIGWAPANPWFAAGYLSRVPVLLQQQKVYIMALPYFLASKFVAFASRGGEDARTSHDFEDIVYILDNCRDSVTQIRSSPIDVQSFLRQELELILSDRNKQEAVLGCLGYATRSDRYRRIMASIESIVQQD